MDLVLWEALRAAKSLRLLFNIAMSQLGGLLVLHPFEFLEILVNLSGEVILSFVFQEDSALNSWIDLVFRVLLVFAKHLFNFWPIVLSVKSQQFIHAIAIRAY